MLSRRWLDYLDRVIDDERTRIVDIPDTMRAWARMERDALLQEIHRA